MSEHESGVPSEPPPQIERQPTGGHRAYEPGDLQDALRIAREGRKIARAHADEFAKFKGRDPDPKREGDEGEGILGRIGMLELTVGDAGDPIRKREPSGLVGGQMALSQAVRELTEELRLGREDRDRWLKRGGAVLMALAVAAALGAGSLAWQWVSTLRHVPATQGHFNGGGSP